MNAVLAPPPVQASQAANEIDVLLERTTYGATRAERALAHSLGYEGWIEHQLNLGPEADAPLEQQLRSSTPLIFASAAELGAIATGEQRQRTQAYNELLAATLLRGWFAKRQLFERMVEFVGDLLHIGVTDARMGTLKILDDREVARAHAFGRFRELLGASARSPAMLDYLDNALNGRDGINDNYARELMELHTLGVDGGYTEEDVVEVARCFSGWTYERRTLRFLFLASWHDNGPKRVLGTPIPAGGGQRDGETVLDLLAQHPSTARHVVTRLARRFVSDQPPPALVNDVAAVFTASGGDLRSTLRALLLHPLTRQSPPLKLKRPFELVVGLLRGLEIPYREGAARLLLDWLGRLGHRPFAWPPPNGYPDTASYWQSPNGLLQRWNFGWEALFGTLAARLPVNWGALLGGAQRAAAVADALAAVFPVAAAVHGQGYFRELALKLAGDGVLSGSARDQLARQLALAMFTSPANQLR
ncbi:MAG: hypothetical protein KatS3mg125_1080 [Lysobacterales bacterium]|jgi:uncharacterized protein (DUF1800 family)|nr:MAG: hypothetical protein KatS3mg125_1080 [Xanthomonadales bacterium]